MSLRHFRRLAPFCLLAVLAGCDSEPEQPAKDTSIIGKRTQDIRQAKPELKKGARVASTKITAKDPITLPANAYRSIVGQYVIDVIKHSLDLFNAREGRYPKDYEEFMAEIIKKPGEEISLPQLPYYQKYGYDEVEHKLIILEYPELKNAPAN